MKSMFFAAAVVLTAGTSVAYAAESGPAANTAFTQMPGVLAQVPVQVPNAAPSAGGRTVQAYVTNARQGTWLFAPNENSNG